MQIHQLGINILTLMLTVTRYSLITDTNGRYLGCSYSTYVTTVYNNICGYYTRNRDTIAKLELHQTFDSWRCWCEVNVMTMLYRKMAWRQMAASLPLRRQPWPPLLKFMSNTASYVTLTEATSTRLSMVVGKWV